MMGISCNGAMGSEFDRTDPLNISFEADVIPATSREIDHPMEEDEIATSVTVEGTTFVAVYGVVDGVIELISSDLGEGRAILAGRPADQVARNLLRKMAREEVLRTEIPFMPDYHLAARRRAKSHARDASQAAP